MATKNADPDFFAVPAKTSRSERIMHRQNVIAAAAAAVEQPKKLLNGPVRRWEKKWVQVAGTMKVFKWVPVKMKPSEHLTSSAHHISDESNHNKENINRVINDNAPITRSITASYGKHNKRPASVEHAPHFNEAPGGHQHEHTTDKKVDLDQTHQQDEHQLKRRKTDEGETNEPTSSNPTTMEATEEMTNGLIKKEPTEESKQKQDDSEKNKEDAQDETDMLKGDDSNQSSNNADQQGQEENLENMDIENSSSNHPLNSESSMQSNEDQDEAENEENQNGELNSELSNQFVENENSNQMLDETSQSAYQNNENDLENDVVAEIENLDNEMASESNTLENEGEDENRDFNLIPNGNENDEGNLSLDAVERELQAESEGNFENPEADTSEFLGLNASNSNQEASNVDASDVSNFGESSNADDQDLLGLQPGEDQAENTDFPTDLNFQDPPDDGSNA